MPLHVSVFHGKSDSVRPIWHGSGNTSAALAQKSCLRQAALQRYLDGWWSHHLHQQPSSNKGWSQNRLSMQTRDLESSGALSLHLVLRQYDEQKHLRTLREFADLPAAASFYWRTRSNIQAATPASKISTLPSTADGRIERRCCLPAVLHMAVAPLKPRLEARDTLVASCQAASTSLLFHQVSQKRDPSTQWAVSC